MLSLKIVCKLKVNIKKIDAQSLVAIFLNLKHILRLLYKHCVIINFRKYFYDNTQGFIMNKILYLSILFASGLLATGSLGAMSPERYLEIEYSELCDLNLEQSKLMRHLETALSLNKKFDSTFKDIKTDEDRFEFVEYCYEEIDALSTDETHYVCPILDLLEERNDIGELLLQIRQYYEENLLTRRNKAIFCILPRHIQEYYAKSFNYKNLFELKYLWIAKIFNDLLMKAIKAKNKKQVENLLKKYNYKYDHKKFTAILLYAIKGYFKTKKKHTAIIRELLNAGANVVIQYSDPNPAVARCWLYDKEGNHQKEVKALIPGIVCSNLAYESEICGPDGLRKVLKKYKDYLVKEI
jgi:hypothetical protein